VRFGLSVFTRGLEEFELRRVDMEERTPVGLRLDLGQHPVDRVVERLERLEPFVPRSQACVPLLHLPERPLELEDPPHRDRIPMLHWRDSLELPQCTLPVPAVVEEMTSIDPRVVQIGIEPERPANLSARAEFIPQPMQAVSHRGGGLGVVREARGSPREDVARLGVHLLSVECPTHGEHELDIVDVAHPLDLVEELQSPIALTEAKKRLAEADHRVLVTRVQHERLLEGGPSPGVLFAREPRVPQPHIEIHGVGIKRKALLEHLESPFVVAAVVELVRLLVVFLGTEEGVGHVDSGWVIP